MTEGECWARLSKLEAILEVQAQNQVAIFNQLRTIGTYLAEAELTDVRREYESRYKTEQTRFKVYSQSDEDGLIQWIAGKLGIENGYFCEIGVEDGLECNSRLLLQIGWSGRWIEANSERLTTAHSLWRQYLDKGVLEIQERFVTPDNVSDILPSDLTNSLDVLSIDIDGNDLWVWQNLVGSPKVVVVEYNAKFPPPISVVQPCEADYVWQKDDFFGASLAALDKLGCEKGYKLVACSSAGTNAFFVRNEFGHLFPELPLTALYRPNRYDLCYNPYHNRGHAPSPKVYELF